MARLTTATAGRAVAMLISGVAVAAIIAPASGDGERAAIVLLSTPGQAELTTPLARAVDAHLSALPVTQGLATVPAIPEDPAEQADLARRLAGEHEAVAAYWLSGDPPAVRVLAPGRDALPATLGAPGGDPGSPEWCEVVAAMIHSELAPLLPEASVLPEPEPEPGVLELRAAVLDAGPGSGPEIEDEDLAEARSAEADAGPAEPEPEPEPESRDPGVPPEPAPPVRIYAAAGYAPTIPDVSYGVAHGAALSLGVSIPPHVLIGVGIDLAAPLRLVAEEGAFRVYHWPLRLTLAGLLPIAMFDLGVRVGGIVEPRRARGFDAAPEADRSAETHVYGGFSAAVLLRWRPLRFLAVELEVGTDLFPRGMVFTEDETHLGGFGNGRPRAVIGLAGSLGVGG